ncbi:MAG: hypothetical protein QW735_03695 [archaeon]
MDEGEGKKRVYSVSVVFKDTEEFWLDRTVPLLLVTFRNTSIVPARNADAQKFTTTTPEGRFSPEEKGGDQR